MSKLDLEFTRHERLVILLSNKINQLGQDLTFQQAKAMTTKIDQSREALIAVVRGDIRPRNQSRRP